MFHLRDVLVGCDQVQAPIEPVIRRPLLWLDWIERYRATVTWAPNFAYGLIVDRAQELTELAEKRRDLSSMRYLLNAGEAVMARTARRFLSVLAPHGLPADSMRPVWGMSETCSGVTASHEFRLESTRDDDPFVEVGLPLPSISLRIVDAEDVPVPEGRTGRLQVKGATVTTGYYGRPELAAEVFTEDGWFKTGDLGTLRGGRLTITGREKDVIIVNGVNYYSHEIESVVEAIPGVEVSFTAACGVRTGGDTDRLAVFFHPRVEADDELRHLIHEIRREVSRRLGLTPEHLVPVGRAEIPKTNIGKIQRAQLKTRFEAGGFEAELRRVDLLLGTAHTVPDWFFRQVWRRESARSSEPQTVRTLLVLGEEVLGDTLREAIPGSVVIDSEQLSARLESLAGDGWWPERVVRLASYGAVRPIESVHDLEAAQEGGALSVLRLVQALAAIHQETHQKPLELIVIGSQTQSVHPGDPVASERATVLGLLKSIPAELPWLTCRHVDVETGGAGKAQILRELGLPAGEAEVAWRGGERWVPRLAKADVH